jgi:cytochrome c peroxidase
LKAGVIAVLLTSVIAFSFFTIKKEKAVTAPEVLIGKRIAAQADSFSFLVNKLQIALKPGAANGKQLRQLFLQTRLAYKKMEWASEYFTPTITRLVNGAPVLEVEQGSQQTLAPEGLQVIEAFLFPRYNAAKIKKLSRYLGLLQAESRNYAVYFKHVQPTNWQIFDAAKQQIFRILTLGITGFDSPLSLHSVQESEVSLGSLQAVIAAYQVKDGTDSLMRQINAAKGYLHSHTNFNTFDRAYFITSYGNKISTGLVTLQRQLQIPVVKYNRLLNEDVHTLFEKDAFNANAYGTDLDAVTDTKIALGKRLFIDPLLSGNGARSCATCHQPERGFTDGLVKNTIISGKVPLRRNTPTLLNAALQPAQFYDMRVNTLEEQVVDVMNNKDEMHGSISKTLNRLVRDNTYRQLFWAAYPNKDSTGIDTLELTNAIASYIRSLTLLNSRFDSYMRGDKAAMNQSEVNGFNLFMGKAKCATCHYMPLFNGTLPPKYLKTESEVIGVPRSKTGKLPDPDPGQFSIIQIASYKHAFKTPTLRNIARTAPYMHNGVFTSLKEVVDFYNKGGGAGEGVKLTNQTLSSEPLHLTVKERSELIAFMKSLDSH